MNNIEYYWNEWGYGIAYSDSMGLYEMEKHIIDHGYIISKVNGGYIHFYDPKKAAKLYKEEVMEDFRKEEKE